MIKLETTIKHTEENPPFFDEEERLLIEAAERGEFKTVPNFEQRKKDLETQARESIRMRKAISIRLQRGDIHRIKQMAEKEGIPYQTLIASIVHRYAEGTLKRDD